jgi:hypothetical protein
VQLAASPPTTTSTGAFGKYDFMNAKTWLGIASPDASHTSPSVQGLLSADRPREQFLVRPGEVPAV